MKILITGATGYIGKRLIHTLTNQGHQVVCAVRDILRFDSLAYNQDTLEVVEVDFLKPETLSFIPKDIEVAYYLIHSMSNSTADFDELEKTCAINFKTYISKTQTIQVIYLSGISNDHNLSKHLASRKNVEKELVSKDYALTTFRAGIIVGSGSASFEIIRDLVEKLPLMVTPKWLNTNSQPIGVRDVMGFLSKAAGNTSVFNQTFDIVGPEILSYKTMLLQFAKVRKLKRYILTIPIMTPKLSSYWLYFVTSTSYKLAQNLVASMGVEIIGNPSNINDLLQIKPMNYATAVKKAFVKIEQNEIISSWKDSFVSGRLNKNAHNYINIPVYGCFRDHQKVEIDNNEKVIDRVWRIGGNTGWYYGTILWKIRGLIDKMLGGIGLRRGRKSDTDLEIGDALDFWRVIYANKEHQKLLLYAEMRLPGEAWLEFKIENNVLYQTATFRPKGLWGRMYWYMMLPFHWFIFKGMITNIAKV
jgi:uncharacterized protein YbjT (DUF2867 family)